jgi:phosphatidate cytidylyltransferase
MLAQRVITAVVGIPAILALILIGGVAYAIAAAVFIGLAALEFFAITDPQSPVEPGIRLQTPARPFYRPRPPAALGAVAVVFLVLMAQAGLDGLTGALAAAVAGVFLFHVLRGDPAQGLREWLWTVAGIAYVGFFGAHLVLLRDLPDGAEWVIVGVFGTFAADTFAYFAGRTLGRRRIAPAISPGKTVEGTLAGFAGGFVSVLLLNRVTGLDTGAPEIVALALLIPLFALIGDLSESLIKRGVGVKDTSEMIPGHGGFLDRMDAVLFTTPLVYYFVTWVL